MAKKHISKSGWHGKTPLYVVHPIKQESTRGANSARVTGAKFTSYADKNCVGEVQNESHNGANFAPKPTVTVTERPTEGIEADFRRVLDAAEVHGTDRRILKHRGIFGEWLEQGYDIETEILPGIRKAIAERPLEITSSLARFTSTIAKIHRQRSSKHDQKFERSRSFEQSRSPEAKTKSLEVTYEIDGEDPRMADLRRDMHTVLGIKFANYGHAATFIVEEDFVTIHGPFSARLLDELGETGSRKLAERHGFRALR